MVELVARFRQLSAGHVHAALFADCASKTPCDRALKRLCGRGYLARLIRPVGGDGGGSSQYVYQLGRAGWRLLGLQGTFWTARSVNLHSLAIADCFIQLRVAEQQGLLTVLLFDTEPRCHRGLCRTFGALIVGGGVARPCECGGGSDPLLECTEVFFGEPGAWVDAVK